MSKILVIGEAPGDVGPPDTPLEGAVGRRIAELAGLSWDDYLALTERRNLLAVNPGETWPTAEAAAAGDEMMPQLFSRRTILLGQRVARAFGARVPPLQFEPILEGRPDLGKWAVVPHPSGRNRWWNEPENRSAARRFLRETFGTEG